VYKSDRMAEENEIIVVVKCTRKYCLHCRLGEKTAAVIWFYRFDDIKNGYKNLTQLMLSSVLENTDKFKD